MKINKSKKEYIGARAKLYEVRRKNRRVWREEQKIILKFLREISQINNKNIKILDIPVGTGRFFEFYKKLNFLVTGIDISKDMLKEAEKKNKLLKLNAKLKKGDIINIKIQNKSMDLVLCIRILNLLNFNNFSKALNELVRVSDKYIICGIMICPSLKNEPVLRCINILLRRIFSNFFSLIKGDRETIRHSENQVLSQFKKRSLVIYDKARIDTGRGGYAYYIYCLKKEK